MKRSNSISKPSRQAKVSQLNSKTYGNSDIFSCMRNRRVGWRLGPPGWRADGKGVYWLQVPGESTEEFDLSCDGGRAKASATDDREVSTNIGIKGVGLLALYYYNKHLRWPFLKGGGWLGSQFWRFQYVFLWVKRQLIVLGLHGRRGLTTLQRGKIR